CSSASAAAPGGSRTSPSSAPRASFSARERATWVHARLERGDRVAGHMPTLEGKTLFITGGSRGIGLAIGLRAARDGANVALAAKTTEPHPRLPGTVYTAAEEIQKAGGKALPCVVDIRFEDQVRAAVEQTVKTFGGIDILVNNASAIHLSGTVETPMKKW